MPGDDIESRGGGVKRNSNNNNNNTSSSGYTSISTYLIEDTETQWTSWLVPMFVVANIAVFIVVMYLNNCPKHRHTRLVGKCVAKFLGRFSFEPLRENPLFGPSSSTMWQCGLEFFYLFGLLNLLQTGPYTQTREENGSHWCHYLRHLRMGLQ